MPFFPFLISVYFLLASLAETQLGKNCDFPSPHHHIHRYWYFHVLNDLGHISTPFMANTFNISLKVGGTMVIMTVTVAVKYSKLAKNEMV